MRGPLALALACTLSPQMIGPAVAGPIMIAPTTVDVAPSTRAGVIEITNVDADPVDLQLRAYAWTQPDGADRLVATDDLVISPAIVTIAPGAKQVFRILRTATTSDQVEPSYRVRINQLPKPNRGGITVNLEFSVPVFFSGRQSGARLSWSATGRDRATVRNDGNRRVRLSALSVADQSGAIRTLEGSASSYLLAGSAKTFSLTPGAALPPRARLAIANSKDWIDASPPALAAR